MKYMLRKLHSRKGETIIETIIGMLIVAMASVVLVTGVVKASEINKATKKAMDHNQFTHTPSVTNDTQYKLMSPTLSGYDIELKYYEDANHYMWFEKK